MLKKEKFLKKTDLQAFFKVSLGTIHRDLKELERKGILIVTYGGVVPASKQLYAETELDPWQKRINQSVNEKIKIAEKASEYIQNNTMLALDSGTTAFQLARQLDKFDNLSIITNNLYEANILIKNPSNKVYLIGGMLREHGETAGYLAKEFLNSFSLIDLYFFSCDGLTLEDGFTTASMENNEIKRIMVEKAEKKIAIVDHTKFGKKTFFKSFDFQFVDILITDSLSPVEYIQSIRDKGVQVVVVDTLNDMR